MATAHTVKATIAPEREAESDRWCDEQRCSRVLQERGTVGATRHQAIVGTDGCQNTARLGAVSERPRAAPIKVWP